MPTATTTAVRATATGTSETRTVYGSWGLLLGQLKPDQRCRDAAVSYGDGASVFSVTKAILRTRPSRSQALQSRWAVCISSSARRPICAAMS
jgi:hypothetical protein